MQLFNQTPLAARVGICEVAKGEPRTCVLTAKATFRFDLSGDVEFETQEPFPLFAQNQPTPPGFQRERPREDQLLTLTV